MGYRSSNNYSNLVRFFRKINLSNQIVRVAKLLFFDLQSNLEELWYQTFGNTINDIQLSVAVPGAKFREYPSICVKNPRIRFSQFLLPHGN